VSSLRIVFAGTPEVAVPTLRTLVASNHEVVGVLTRPDAPTGRGRRMQASAVAQAADDLDLPRVQPASLSESDARQVLESWHPDVVVVVAYGLLIPPSLLDLPQLGWINAHFSALPRWRGAAPVQYAIAHGDPTIAVTTFRIEQGLDTGPILRQSSPISIGNREDAGGLLTRLSVVAGTLVVDTLDGLAGGATNAVRQSTNDATYAPRITPDDAHIDWTQQVDVVDRWIRACTPAPGAWSMVHGTRMRLGSPIGVIHDAAAIPAVIVVEKNRVLVGARGGYLELGGVQPMGKKEMSAPDWVRGFRGRAPERFDS